MKDKQSSDPHGNKRSAAAAGRKPPASRKGASVGDLKARIEALERDLAQTRKAVQESNEQCRFLFHDSLMINVIIGLDGKVLDLNDRASESIGYSREELIGIDTAEMFAPECREFAEALLGKALRGEPTEQAELTLIGKTGPRTYIFTAGQAPIHQNGELIGILVSGVDVTERRRAQEARNESQERYRTLIENLPVGLGRITPEEDGRFIMVNPAMARMFGYASVEEFVQKPVSELYQDSPQWEAFLRGLRTDCRVVGMEMHLRRRDGTPWWASVTVNGVRGPAGRVEYFDGMVDDVTERKRTEEALRESKRRLQLILQCSTDGINIAELDTRTGKRRLILCNDRYLEMAGRSREEMFAVEDLDTLLRLSPPEQVKEDLGRMMRGEPFAGVTSWHRPDGRENHFEWRASAMRKDEHHFSVIGVDRDVTQRKQAEEALRKWEEDTRQLLDGLDGFLWTADARPGITNWEMQIPSIKGFERVTGYKPEETVQATARYINGIALPEDIPAKDQAGKRAVAGEIDGYYQEYRIRHKNGEVRWLGESVRVASRTDSGVRFIGACLNITQRKQAEEALRASEERFRTIFDAASDTFFVLDFDGRILEANAHASKMYGHSHEEFIDLSIRTLTHCSHQRLIDQLLKSVHARHEFHAEAVNVRKDARPINVDLRATVVDFRGHRHILLTLHDITERKQAERTMQALHRQLITAREKERSRLARELHDSIGQSLVAMRLAMQTTISGAKHCMDEPMLSTLTAAAEKCNSLIGEVRTICHGLYPPALESLGLLAALRGLAREWQSQVQVSVECLETMEATRFPSEVEIELFRIAQEAANNAMRHSQAGQILLTLVYEDGQAVLTIADNGAGFDSENTLDAGMGLNTMRDRAQTVGGQLTIASCPGGTRVSVRVPTECRRLDANRE